MHRFLFFFFFHSFSICCDNAIAMLLQCDLGTIRLFLLRKTQDVFYIYIAHSNAHTHYSIYSLAHRHESYIFSKEKKNLNRLCASIAISFQRLLFRRIAFIMIWHLTNAFHTNEYCVCITYDGYVCVCSL